MRLKLFILLNFIILQGCTSQKTAFSSPEQTTEKIASTVAILSIEGMACQVGCADKIQTNLLALNGVEKAEVSYEKANAIITFYKDKTSTDAIQKVITDTNVKDYNYAITNLKIKN